MKLSRWLSGALADRLGSVDMPTRKKTGKLQGGDGCAAAGEGSHCIQCPFDDCIAADPAEWYGYNQKRRDLLAQ